MENEVNIFAQLFLGSVNSSDKVRISFGAFSHNNFWNVSSGNSARFVIHKFDITQVFYEDTEHQT